MTFPLPLKWRYAARSGFEITGDRAGLRLLAEMLRQPDSVNESEWSLEIGSHAAPYDQFMDKLILHHDTGRVRVMKQADSVVITGSAKHLGLLADNIEVVAETDEVKDHLHIEYYPDHFYLDQSSEPLVVELE